MRNWIKRRLSSTKEKYDSFLTERIVQDIFRDPYRPSTSFTILLLFILSLLAVAHFSIIPTLIENEGITTINNTTIELSVENILYLERALGLFIPVISSVVAAMIFAQTLERRNASQLDKLRQVGQRDLLSQTFKDIHQSHGRHYRDYSAVYRLQPTDNSSILQVTVDYSYRVEVVSQIMRFSFQRIGKGTPRSDRKLTYSKEDEFKIQLEDEWLEGIDSDKRESYYNIDRSKISIDNSQPAFDGQIDRNSVTVKLDRHLIGRMVTVKFSVQYPAPTRGYGYLSLPHPAKNFSWQLTADEATNIDLYAISTILVSEKELIMDGDQHLVEEFPGWILPYSMISWSWFQKGD